MMTVDNHKKLETHLNRKLGIQSGIVTYLQRDMMRDKWIFGVMFASDTRVEIEVPDFNDDEKLEKHAEKLAEIIITFLCGKKVVKNDKAK